MRFELNGCVTKSSFSNKGFPQRVTTILQLLYRKGFVFTCEVVVRVSQCPVPVPLVSGPAQGVFYCQTHLAGGDGAGIVVGSLLRLLLLLLMLLLHFLHHLGGLKK